MSEIVTVVGKGLLAHFVRQMLSGLYQIVHLTELHTDIPELTSLVLVVNDDWRPSDYVNAEKVLKQARIPWLSGFILYDEGIVGPLVRPGTQGCSQCADMRRLTAGHNNEKTLQMQMDLLMHGVITKDPSVSRLGLLHTACLIASEAQKMLEGIPVHTEGAVYLVDLKNLTTSLHAFLPDPLCPVCACLPADCSEDARITLGPAPKINTDTFRSRSADDLKEVLAKDYLDDRTGLINAITFDPSSPFSNAYVNLPSVMGDSTSTGRSHSFAQSARTAILEGLERYCSISPRGKRTAVRDSFRNLGDRAMDPLQVGVYSAEQYAQPDFPFEVFDPDRQIPWVWGYSFRQERPILVPEQLAYYSLGLGNSFVDEGSNGCALGGSLEEAIFYGILEVVERDSVLLTWYARLPVPRIDPYSTEDVELRLMLERLQGVEGYEVFLFNTALETGIPTIWATLKNRNGSGPNLISAGSAHPDPVHAAKSAIFEAAGSLKYLEYRYREHRQESIRLLDDPFLVERMEHHALIFGHPQAQERLRFLLETNRPLRRFDEEFTSKLRHADLTDDLKELLQRFHQLDLEVIVVNQTTSEIQRNGLFCVKVLIPGMLPMSFGHHLTRLTGLERLFKVPVQLGYSEFPFTAEQINPYPHPFL